MPVSPIAVEEHFWTPELRELRRGFDVLSDPEHGRRLGDSAIYAFARWTTWASPCR